MMNAVIKAMLMGAINGDKGPSEIIDTSGGTREFFITVKSRVAGDGVPAKSI